MRNSSENAPLVLEAPVLEDYPVSHEALLKKMEQTVEFTAHYEDESGEQLIPVSFIPGSVGTKETIIINTPWSDSAHRDFNELRHAALAEHTGADVIIIGFPGHDEELRGGLTPLQRKELVRDKDPSFSGVGKALASALSQLSASPKLKMHQSYWLDKRVTIAGYSQGASSQIGMLEHLDPVIAGSVTDLYIWESADSLEPVKKRDLGKRFILDGVKAGPYYAENVDVFGKKTAKELGIADPGLLALGRLGARMFFTQKDELIHGSVDAIAHSTMKGDLERVYGEGRLDGVRITVINGGDSLVSPPEQGEKLISLLIDQAPKSGEKTQVIKPGDSHPAQESFPNYSGTVKVIKEKLA